MLLFLPGFLPLRLPFDKRTVGSVIVSNTIVPVAGAARSLKLTSPGHNLQLKIQRSPAAQIDKSLFRKPSAFPSA